MKSQGSGRLFALCAAVVLAAGVAWAQELPKPGPEHKVLEMDAGTWDASVEMMTAPGAPPMTGKGTETSTIGCSGLCLITDFKGDFGGMPFHGHGTTTWDPAKKKYVGTWVDSMSMGLALSEGNYDAATKRVTSIMDGPDMSGGRTKSKAVVEYKDANTRVMSMATIQADGKEVPTMKITYTKKN
jgi:hypothetical protein